MVKIIADINIYNGAQFLPAILSAIHKHVDKIVVVDGAWSGLLASGLFKSASSTDVTERIVKAFSSDCPLIWVPVPIKGWESHSHKRVVAMEYLEKGDWWYIMNDDELPVGDLTVAFSQIKKITDSKTVEVPFVELMGDWTDWSKYAELTYNRNLVQWIPRFFRNDGIYYGYCHMDLLDGPGKKDNYLEWNKTRVTSMRIVHLLRLRPNLQKNRKFKPGNLPDVHVRGSKQVLLAQ